MLAIYMMIGIISALVGAIVAVVTTSFLTGVLAYAICVLAMFLSAVLLRLRQCRS